jgi:hypothetical protein
LLFVFMPCCLASSIGTPSSLSCASEKAWSITNKFHPTIGFFSPNYSSVFSLLYMFFFLNYL